MLKESYHEALTFLITAVIGEPSILVVDPEPQQHLETRDSSPPPTPQKLRQSIHVYHTIVILWTAVKLQVVEVGDTKAWIDVGEQTVEVGDTKAWMLDSVQVIFTLIPHKIRLVRLQVNDVGVTNLAIDVIEQAYSLTALTSL